MFDILLDNKVLVYIVFVIISCVLYKLLVDYNRTRNYYREKAMYVAKTNKRPYSPKLTAIITLEHDSQHIQISFDSLHGLGSSLKHVVIYLDKSNTYNAKLAESIRHNHTNLKVSIIDCRKLSRDKMIQRYIKTPLLLSLDADTVIDAQRVLQATQLFRNRKIKSTEANTQPLTTNSLVRSIIQLVPFQGSGDKILIQRLSESIMHGDRQASDISSILGTSISSSFQPTKLLYIMSLFAAIFIASVLSSLSLDEIKLLFLAYVFMVSLTKLLTEPKDSYNTYVGRLGQSLTMPLSIGLSWLVLLASLVNRTKNA